MNCILVAVAVVFHPPAATVAATLFGTFRIVVV